MSLPNLDCDQHRNKAQVELQRNDRFIPFLTKACVFYASESFPTSRGKWRCSYFQTCNAIRRRLIRSTRYLDGQTPREMKWKMSTTNQLITLAMSKPLAKHNTTTSVSLYDQTLEETQPIQLYPPLSMRIVWRSKQFHPFKFGRA